MEVEKRKRGERLHPRKHLLARLLADRTVLRQLRAPARYGKTSLALAYVAQTFQSGGVLWVDGNDPGMICQLDDGSFPVLGETLEGPLRMVVIDDLPFLDERRTKELSAAIDELLARGVEVMLCCTPARDRLADQQPSRILLESRDLELSSQELATLDPFNPLSADQDLLTGMCKVPGLVWSQDEGNLRVCVKSLLQEELPQHLLRPALFMLLIEHGSFMALNAFGMDLDPFDRTWLAKEYPFLGMDLLLGSFRSIPVSPQDLQAVLPAEGLPWLSELVADPRLQGFLLERGSVTRLLKMLGCLCSSDDCAIGLLRWGWHLLDCGPTNEIASLLEQCLPRVGAHPTLVCMRAWALLLAGDGFKARSLMEDLDGAVRREGLGIPVAAHASLELLKLIMGRQPGVAAARMASGEARILDDGDDGEAASWQLLLQVMRLHCDLMTCAGGAAEGGAASRLASALFKGSALYESLGFRLALHLGLIHRNSMERQDAEFLDSLLSQARSRLLANGAQGTSRALLLLDCHERGLLAGPSASQRTAVMLNAALTSLGRSLQLLEAVVSSGAADEGLCRRCGLGRDQLASLYAQSTDGFPAALATASSMEMEKDAEPSPMCRSRLYVKLLGGFEVYLDGRFLESKEWNRSKVRSVVAFLVLHKGSGVSRDRLCDELWPDSDLKQSRNCFYTVWSYIRKGLGCSKRDDLPFFGHNAGSCWASDALVGTDVERLLELSRLVMDRHLDTRRLMADYTEILALYRGSLLGGDHRSPTICELDQVLREVFVDCMVRAAEWAADMNDGFSALRFAREAFIHGSRREDVFRALMRAQIVAGQRAAAIDTFERCSRFVNDELGVPLSSRTRRIYEEFISSEEDEPLRALST
ncbi:MAG: hypothetical protein IJH83_03305 [Coriobacteriales bacterium]|nr:hypothetical protein [Coriobacteriales bacterium]